MANGPDHARDRSGGGENGNALRTGIDRLCCVIRAENGRKTGVMPPFLEINLMFAVL